MQLLIKVTESLNNNYSCSVYRTWVVLVKLVHCTCSSGDYQQQRSPLHSMHWHLHFLPPINPSEKSHQLLIDTWTSLPHEFLDFTEVASACQLKYNLLREMLSVLNKLSNWILFLPLFSCHNWTIKNDWIQQNIELCMNTLHK